MSEAAKKQEGGATGSTSVLIVEDEWMVAWDLERSLKEMGYQVVATVDSSHEALRVAAERRPDVALMDIRINGDSDGITTAAALSQQFGVPVVYLTAYTDDATLSRAAQTQAYGYVVKPFTSREVRSAIEVARHKHAADARLAQSERWLATTLRSIGDAGVACDGARAVRLMNPAAEALTGWKEAEARGRPVEEVVRIHSGSAPHDPLRDALENRAIRTLPPGATLVPRGGGEPTEIDDSAAPIEHEGAVLGAVLVFRDVTRQRRAQRQQEASDRLASLGAMAAGVGQELADPLSFVTSNVGLLAAGLDQVEAAIHNGQVGPELSSRVEEMIEVVDEVKVSTERIRRIVSDLDLFNRPAGDPRAPVDVRELLQWALRVTGGQVRHRGRLSSDLQPVPRVMASEIGLGQVFVNLLAHAAHSLPAGAEDSNEVRVRCGLAPDGRVSVTVADTGGGISPEHLDRLFTPSFSPRAAGAGAGMGLSVSHNLVTALGGELRARSKLGEGTTFEVLLPVPERERPEAPPQPAAGTARLLVVDDEPLVGRAIKRALGRKYDVVAMDDPQEAMRLLESGEPFDAVLCDLMMPGLNGMDFHERLRRFSPVLAERTVFLTGGAFSGPARRFLEAVKNARVEKPFDVRVLEGVVSEVLGKKP